MATEKWSAFTNGGAMVSGDQLVGLRSGANVRLTPVTSAQIQASAFNAAAATGVNDAFVVTLSPVPSALTDGLLVTMDSGSLVNLTSSPTLKVNTFAAKPIVTFAGAPAPGDIQTNGEYIFVYSLTNDHFQLINPSTSTADTFQVQSSGYSYALDTGVANAYIANILPAQLTTQSGLQVVMTAVHANTGASTLTVNGSVYPIVLSNGAPLVGGEILADGIYQFFYSTALTSFVLINSSASAVSSSSANVITASGGTTTLTALSAPTQIINGTTFQVIKLPVTSTLSIGKSFTIINNTVTTDTGFLLIASDSTVVGQIFPGTVSTASCVSTSDTSLSGWSFSTLLSSASLLNYYVNYSFVSPYSGIVIGSSAPSSIYSSIIVDGVSYRGLLSFTATTAAGIPVATSLNFGNAQSTGTAATITQSMTSFIGDQLLNCSSLSMSSAALTTMSFNSLLVVQGNISISAGSITAFDFPALVACIGSFSITATSVTTTNVPLLKYIGTSGLVLTAASGLQTINMPALLYILGPISGTTAALTTFTVTNLSIITGAFSLVAAILTTLSMPALTQMQSTWSTTMASVTSTNFSSLQTVSGAVSASFAALTTLSFPAIVSFGSTVTFTAGNLVTFSMGSTLLSVGGNWSMAGMKLDQASVDRILVSLAALDGTGGTTAYSSKTVNLSGGTSSTPSATGLAAKVTLQARGCTVTTN